MLTDLILRHKMSALKEKSWSRREQTRLTRRNVRTAFFFFLSLCIYLCINVLCNYLNLNIILARFFWIMFFQYERLSVEHLKPPLDFF